MMEKNPIYALHRDNITNKLTQEVAASFSN